MDFIATSTSIVVTLLKVFANFSGMNDNSFSLARFICHLSLFFKKTFISKSELREKGRDREG